MLEPKKCAARLVVGTCFEATLGARAGQAQRQDVELEVKTGKKRANPAQDNISVARKASQKAYGQIARALATGDAEDKRLALDIVRLIQTMPPAITKHEALVQTFRSKTSTVAGPREELKTLKQGRAKPDGEQTR